MIRHVVAEGWLLLRQRLLISAVLALALAVPISLGGLTLCISRWLQPITEMSEEESVVAVLLHPQLDQEERREWIETEGARHSAWKIRVVPPEQLAERLARWFPYLGDLFKSDGGTFLPPLVEISTDDVGSIDSLEASPAVIAIGPRSSVHQAVGGAARDSGWLLGILSAVLLASAAALAAVWVHLEVYRHSDEITIMRLIGATEGAIRGPFLLGVVAPGVLAAAISTVATTICVAQASKMTAAVGLPEIEVTPLILGLQIAVGCLLPLLTGAVTLARHAYLESDI